MARINTNDGFIVFDPVPIDGRSVVATLAGIDDYSVYEGSVVYNEDDNQLYVYNADPGNPPNIDQANWVVVGGGGGVTLTPATGDVTTINGRPIHSGDINFRDFDTFSGLLLMQHEVIRLPEFDRAFVKLNAAPTTIGTDGQTEAFVLNIFLTNPDDYQEVSLGQNVDSGTEIRTVSALPGGAGFQFSTPFYDDDVLVQEGDIIYLLPPIDVVFSKDTDIAALYRYRLVSQELQGWLSLDTTGQYSNRVLYAPGEVLFNNVGADTDGDGGIETSFRAIPYNNPWATDENDPSVGGVFQTGDIVGFIGIDGTTDIAYYRWDGTAASTATDIPGVEVLWVLTFRPFALGIEPGDDDGSPDWRNYWEPLTTGPAATLRQGAILPGNTLGNNQPVALPTSYLDADGVTEIVSTFSVGDLFLFRTLPAPPRLDQDTIPSGIWTLRPANPGFTLFTWSFISELTQWNSHVQYFAGQIVIQFTDAMVATTYLAKIPDGDSVGQDNINIEPGSPSDIWRDFWTLVYTESGLNQGVNITDTTPEPGIADATFKTLELFDRFGSDGADPIRGTRWELAKSLNAGAADRATLPEIVDASKWGIAPTGTKPSSLSWGQVISPVSHDSVRGEIVRNQQLGADFRHDAVTNSLMLRIIFLIDDDRQFSIDNLFLVGSRAVGPVSDIAGAGIIESFVEVDSTEPDGQGGNRNVFFLDLTFETPITVIASDEFDGNIELYSVDRVTIHTIEGGTYQNGVLTITTVDDNDLRRDLILSGGFTLLNDVADDETGFTSTLDKYNGEIAGFAARDYYFGDATLGIDPDLITHLDAWFLVDNGALVLINKFN